MRWEQGRTTIEALLAQGHLQAVPANAERAENLLAQAVRHLNSAKELAPDDREGAYALVYDAARKALAALLENQGLRATSSGGCIVLYEAVRAQLDPPLGKLLRPFQRLRRKRNSVEYPDFLVPALSDHDFAEDSAAADEIVRLARRMVQEMPPF
jgi:HEPN domain-containing protein